MAVSVSAIAGTPVQLGTSIPFRVIAQGSDSRINAPRELIIRLPGVWDFVWHKHANSAPPVIDFSRVTVIAIFGGSQSTAPRALQITGVSDEDGSVVVRYQAVNDQARRDVARSPNSSFVIISIPSRRAPVKFVKAEPRDGVD